MSLLKLIVVDDYVEKIKANNLKEGPLNPLC